MNKQQLKSAAILLEEQLKNFMDDPDVERLTASLSSLIRAYKDGTIVQAMEWRDIPGAYWFTEGTLSKFGDLESAYAGFRVELTGGPSPGLLALR
jgi:hypothetical protein